MKKDIKLIHIGTRLGNNEAKLFSAFVKEDPKTWKKHVYMFKQRASFFIGDKYKATEDGDEVQLWSSVRYEDEEITDEKLLEKWRMESIAAETLHKKNLSKARVEKYPLPEHLLSSLKNHVSQLSHRDSKAFLEYLVDAVLFRDLVMNFEYNIKKAVQKRKRK